MTHSLVVSTQTMNTTFNQNQSEFAIHILSISLQVLSYLHSFLDQMIQIFGDFGSKSSLFQDSKDLVTSYESHLGNALRVPI